MSPGVEPADPDALLDAVTTALDALAAAGADHRGLFPSLLNRETGAMLPEFPAAIPGQRDSDRAHRGSNLLHDAPALKALYGLADPLDRPDYAGAADRYLETFATECTDTPTGLFPWGEHAYWRLDEWRVGDSYANPGRGGHDGSATHDHLRLAPAWLWNRLTDFEPTCLQRFADGLDYHWLGVDRREYIRHAPISARERGDPTGDRSCDFPRHGGHYVHDWALAHRECPREWPRQSIERTVDYWWDRRTEWDLLPLESRGRTDELHPGQTLAHAISLLDAAEHLGDREPRLAATMRERADAYLDAFLAVPHDPESDTYLAICRARDLRAGAFEPRVGPDVRNEIRPLPLWGSVYGGGGLAANRALQACCAYRHTGDERLLAWARAVGETHRSVGFPEGGRVGYETANAAQSAGNSDALSRGDDVPVVAGDAGRVLGLFADLADLTGDGGWASDGLALAGPILEAYLDAPLPRAAGRVDRYESQSGPGYLLHDLARLALLAREAGIGTEPAMETGTGVDGAGTGVGVDVPLGPDYSER
jgi:hypothetical protein